MIVDLYTVLCQHLTNEVGVSCGGNIGVLFETSLNALLEKACRDDNTRAIAYLIDNGADIDKPLATEGYNTYLMEACRRGAVETAELLVRKGADLNVRNEDGLTALNYAWNECHLNLVVTLVTNGADIDSVEMSPEFNDCLLYADQWMSQLDPDYVRRVAV
jgi:ankyrin repeat protein